MIDLSEQTRYITGARPFDPVRYTLISSRILKTTLGYNYNKKVIRRRENVF